MSAPDDPCRRFLGIASEAAPWEILGLADPDASASEIAAAILRRWSQIDADPHADSPQARLARRAVTEAAKRMRHGGRRSPQPSRRAGAPADEIDGELVGALRAARGRRGERARRLAAVGRRHGLPPQAVLERLRSLQRAASLKAPLPRSASGVRRGPVERELAGLIDRLDVAERRGAGEGTPRSVPIPIAAAIAAALVAVAAMFVVGLPERRGASSTPPQTASSASGEPRAASPQSREDAPGDPPSHATGERADAAERPISLPPPADLGWPIGFDPRQAGGTPGDGEGRRGAAVAAALADAASLPERLEDLAQRIRGERGELTAAIEAAWAELQRIAGTCWPLLSPSQRRAILGGAHACLRAIDSWRAAANLVAATSPRAPAAAPPLELWQRAWRAALLGDLAARSDLAPLVREELERALEAIELPRRVGFTGRTAFEETAARWLAAAAAPLAEGTLESSRIEAWWWWIAAGESITPASLREAVDVAALQELLAAWEEGASPAELAMRRAVAAALLARIDPALPESPAFVRSSLLEMIGGGGLPAAAASSLAESLRDSPGFAAMAGLPRLGAAARSGDLAAWAEAAGRLWPAGRSSQGVRVDAAWLEQWDRLRASLSEPSRGGDAEALQRAVQAGRLAESAARIGDDPQRARQLLEAIERDVAAEHGSMADPPRVSGRPQGRDGEWAAAMTAALADPPMRVELLRRLRGRGGDLGPLDAEALVRAVIADGPQVRTVAAGVLLEQFSDGPQVLRALLGRLDGRDLDESFAEVLDRLVEGGLPPWEDPRHLLEARRGVIERLLRTEPSELRRLDRLGSRYAATLANLAASLGMPGGSGGGTDPVEEAGLLADGLMAGVDGESLAAIAERRSLRRRLAEHAPARLVSEQAAVAESLAAMRRGGEAGMGEEAAAILAALSQRRREASSSLEQVLAGAMAIADLLRLDLRASRSPPRASRGGPA